LRPGSECWQIAVDLADRRFYLRWFVVAAHENYRREKKLYEAPEGSAPPPFWIRGLLMLTCTGVSFFHGSNDGQKGMGLIMLILIGTVPTTYALNHALTPTQTQDFIAVSQQAATALDK
jgi:inorganic phosphate transporter, PiT family